MKIKVISLATAVERQQKIKQNFDAKNMAYELVEGVSINDIKFDKSNCTYNFDNTNFLINKDNLLKYTNRLWVRFGEMAALMAHYRLWKALQDDLDEEVYLICEDDCLPAEGFKIDLLTQFDYSKIDFLYLQAITAHHQNKQNLIDSLPFVSNDSNLKLIDRFKNYVCEGLAAYCITKKGAKKLCEYIECNGYDGPVDNIITRLKNFDCMCPSNLNDYFYLDDTASYSYTHSGDFFNKYDLNGIELQSKQKLNFITQHASLIL
jgi:GR25 family glycosyltransferase involved in LPS biosynthesis